MRWFDPLTEKWIVTREPCTASTSADAPLPEDDHARGARLVRQANVWAAIVASATACQMGDAKGEPAEEDANDWLGAFRGPPTGGDKEVSES